MSEIEDFWRNRSLFKNIRLASSLAYDLIAIRKLFTEDVNLSTRYVIISAEFIRKTEN